MVTEASAGAGLLGRLEPILADDHREEVAHIGQPVLPLAFGKKRSRAVARLAVEIASETDCEESSRDEVGDENTSQLLVITACCIG